VRDIGLTPEQAQKYEQTFVLDGRSRTIAYREGRLVFDDWFVMHPVSRTRFILEDMEKV